MSNNRVPEGLWFLVGLTLGIATVLLAVTRTSTGRELYARGKEAKDAVKDVVDVVQRGKRLKRPLGES